jgi:hypothetical protein
VTSSIELPAEVDATIERLRRLIRRYVLWEGLALTIVVIGVAFWATFGLDWIYFQTSRLELPRWLRALLTIGMVAIVVGAAVSLIALRAVRSLRARALAMVLERRFPELDDRLITVVEACEMGVPNATPATRYLLERTVGDLSRTISRLDLPSVFDPRPLRRSLVLAAMTLVSVFGLFIADTSAMTRWMDGFVRLRDGYWPRETELVVRVVAAPGDRIRDFQSGTYRHPRGTDLVLQIEVPEGRKTPERVRLDYDLAGGRGRGRVYLVPTRETGVFRHAMPDLLDDVELWVTGGDYTSPEPLTVDVADPPALTRLQLACRYPEYTTWNTSAEAEDRTIVPVSGTQVSLPIGTDFQMQGGSVEPLAEVALEGQIGGRPFELRLAGGAARPTLVLRRGSPGDGNDFQEYRWPADVARKFWSDNDTAWQFPFLLTMRADENAVEWPPVDETTGLPRLPLELPAETMLRITLLDQHEIAALEPARLVVGGIVDQIPLVDAELRGIGNSITRQARIPITGIVTDDYGVASVRFETLVDQATEWNQQPVLTLEQPAAREVPLESSTPGQPLRFDVLPLNLDVKQRLVVTVVATDRDTVTGPHEGRSQRFAFTVVSVDELLSVLYAKELNLRKRFEQLISEMRVLQEDSLRHRGLLDEAPTPENHSAIQLSAERARQAVRKTLADLQSMELGFRDLRDELVNNGAETPQALDRLNTKIIAPLNRAVTERWPSLDNRIDGVRQQSERGFPEKAAYDGLLTEVAAAVTDLDRILLEMRKLETFQEAMELLKGLITDQEGLLEQTKTRRKENALKALELE